MPKVQHLDHGPVSAVERYHRYVSAVKGPKLDAQMPCCGQQLTFMVPSAPGQIWDTFMTCPHCGTMVHKVASSWSLQLRIPGNPEAV